MQDLQFVNHQGIYVKAENEQKLIPGNHMVFVNIVTNYYNTVISDSKQPTGPLFRHYHKKSNIFTKTPLGLKPILNIKQDLQITNEH